MKIIFDDEICKPWIRMPNNKYKTFVDKMVAIIEKDFNIEFNIRINKYVRYDPKHFGKLVEGAYIANVNIVDNDRIHGSYTYTRLYVIYNKHMKTSIYKHLFRAMCGLDYIISRKLKYYSISIAFKNKHIIYSFATDDIISCIIQLDMGNYEKHNLLPI